jgi:hypothetical protein
MMSLSLLSAVFHIFFAPLLFVCLCVAACTSCTSLQYETTACTSGSNRACTACGANLGNCDGNAANACETNLQTTVTNCGSCGNSCPAVTNGVASCSGGSCTFTCNSGFYRSGSTCTGCGKEGKNTVPKHYIVVNDTFCDFFYFVFFVCSMHNVPNRRV